MTDADDTFSTVTKGASDRFEVRGSTFIGTIAPATSTAEAEDEIDRLGDRYADATHNVPAYRVREEPFREWASDDGEPAGSAGNPVLNVLTGEGLENVVLVVTRYFGGTKLGYGGLVSAYTEAAKRAVAAATVVERRPATSVSVIAAYDDSGTVRGILESEELTFDADYAARVTFQVRVPNERLEAVLDRLRTATSGRVGIETHQPSG